MLALTPRQDGRHQISWVTGSTAAVDDLAPGPSTNPCRLSLLSGGHAE
ncbi:hypothetical protein [Synechococcus sp. UW179A]|nr:hypothetical protein [Synechococcus sp. UW179A]